MVHHKYLLKWEHILTPYIVEKEKQISRVTLPLTRGFIPIPGVLRGFSLSLSQLDLAVLFPWRSPFPICPSPPHTQSHFPLVVPWGYTPLFLHTSDATRQGKSKGELMV